MGGAQHIACVDSWVARQYQVLCLPHEIVLLQSNSNIPFTSQIAHKFWYSYAHYFQPSECSLVIVLSKSRADRPLCTVYIYRKCGLVTRKELGYSVLKPEQLEVIMAFVGGREVSTVVSCDWVREKPLLRLHACQ